MNKVNICRIFLFRYYEDFQVNISLMIIYCWTRIQRIRFNGEQWFGDFVFEVRWGGLDFFLEINNYFVRFVVGFYYLSVFGGINLGYC